MSKNQEKAENNIGGMKSIVAKFLGFIKENNIFILILKGLFTIIPIVISLWSFNVSNEALRDSKMVQPLTYTYDIELDYNNCQDYLDYSIPGYNCTIDIITGALQQSVFFDNATETITYYDLNYVPLHLNLSEKIPLPLNNTLQYDNKIYQYLFVYLESLNGSWELDCIIHEYDPIVNESHIDIWNEIDLLRLDNDEDNDALFSALTDYNNLRQKIIALKQR